MTVDEGTVTAWVGRHPRGAPWSIAVEIENATMKVRAFVSGEDLRFFVTKAFFVRTGWIPDGITERRVVDVTDTDVSLEIGFEKFHTTVFEVPCGELGVVPARIDADPLLSKAGGEVVLKSTAPVLVGSEKLSASSFWAPDAVERPAGTLATERGPRASGANQLVSIETCGGTALGVVSKGDLVGQPKTMRSSSARCPGAPSGTFVAEPPLSKALACSAALPLFLRSATLEDPVGTLKAGARIQVEGHEEKGTTLIRVRNPAVAPTQGASFAVKTADLAGCRASK
jgi:hypothetical protein